MVNFNELLSLLEGYLNHVRSNNNEKLNISMAKSFIPWEFSFVFQRQKKKNAVSSFGNSTAKFSTLGLKSIRFYP